jgi:hypothetical protein
MEENSINLDELLPDNNVEQSEPRDITPTSEQVANEDVTTEDEGIDDTVENEIPNEESIIDEDITEGLGETTEVTEEFIPEEETPYVPEESTAPEPTEYKFKDDFIKKAVDYYETYGTLQPYLEATKVNYDEVDDLEVLKMNFDKENSDLSPKVKQRLFEKQIEKYNLDAFDEDDLEVGQALLKRDANKLRSNLKEEQKQFLESIQPNQTASQPQYSQEELEAEMEISRKIVENGVSGVIKDNLIKIEANGEGINYQIPNANKVVDYALDSTKFLSTFAGADGQINWDKWTKVVAFAENPTLFISELIKHGKSLGRKTMEAELKNVAPMAKSKDIIETTGSDSPYDNPVDFLRGMTVRK